jgi:tryptophan synthase alpha chain
MSRIEALFATGKNRLLNIYFTAGYPELNDTTRIVRALESAGVDLVEIGIPYSDPIADGSTIQESATRALRNGMSLEVLFEQLQGIRKDVSVPIILMGYLNPVMQFGFPKFCQRCLEVGVDGLILPDMPLEIFEKEYREVVKQYSLDFIFLISPNTPPVRIRKLDVATTGFLYLVSDEGTTGTAGGSALRTDYFQRINQMNVKNPTLIGFGISNQEQFDIAATHARGAIVGSAFIRQLANDSSNQAIHQFVNSIRP